MKGDRSMSNKNLPVKYEKTYLGLSKRLTWPEATQLSDTLNRMEEAAQWWIGDFLIITEKEFGEKYAQLVPEGKSQDTWRKYKWVCERAGPGIRVEGLSFSHHEKVAKLTEEEQRQWLAEAKDKGLSVSDLVKAIRASSSITDGEDDEAPDKTNDPLYRHVITCPNCGHKWQKEDD